MAFSLLLGSEQINMIINLYCTGFFIFIYFIFIKGGKGEILQLSLCRITFLQIKSSSWLSSISRRKIFLGKSFSLKIFSAKINLRHLTRVRKIKIFF
jgi:hypothetical protein